LNDITAVLMRACAGRASNRVLLDRSTAQTVCAGPFAPNLTVADWSRPRRKFIHNYRERRFAATFGRLFQGFGAVHVSPTAESPRPSDRSARVRCAAHSRTRKSNSSRTAGNSPRRETNVAWTMSAGGCQPGNISTDQPTDAQSLEDLLFLIGEFSAVIAGLKPIGLQGIAVILPDGHEDLV
jgi:hypothetical protein